MARQSRSTVPRADPSGLVPAAAATTSYGTTLSFGQGRSIQTAMPSIRALSGHGYSHLNRAISNLAHGSAVYSAFLRSGNGEIPTAHRAAADLVDSLRWADRDDTSADSRTDHRCTTRPYSSPIHVPEQLPCRRQTRRSKPVSEPSGCPEPLQKMGNPHPTFWARGSEIAANR